MMYRRLASSIKEFNYDEDIEAGDREIQTDGFLSPRIEKAKNTAFDISNDSPYAINDDGGLGLGDSSGKESLLNESFRSSSSF